MTDHRESEDPRKKTCRELAEELAGEEGLRLARRLQMAGLMEAGPVAGGGVGEMGEGGEDRAGQESGAGEAPSPRPISIWRPESRGGETVWGRPAPGPFGDHYAARRELHPRRGATPRRVAFFGESAAAGYLYAPHLTPARVLEAQLQVAAGEGAYEVIDLARTNETLASMAATVEASLQLEPDLLVIYAGNNWNLLETPGWSPYPPSVTGRQRYALALGSGGLAGPVAEARRELGRVAGRTLTAIAAAAREPRLPVVLLVPEVNLADWESRQPVAWLPDDGVERWYGLYRRARRHLEAGEYRQAVGTAWAMIDLDGESCPTSCRLLATAYRGLGDLARAREAALAEVDAGAYATLCLLGAPQATSTVRELLFRAVERFGWRAVDLRRVLAEHGGSPLPGRRYFLDYCHLTVEGMQVAMAAVAGEVLGCTGGRRPGAGALPAGDLPNPALSPEADATAKLGAAVHTAHRLVPVGSPVGSKIPLLQHWLRQALAASPGVAAAMLHLVTARSAPLPAVLTAAQQENAASPYPLSLQHGWRWEHLDADLLAALLGVLDELEGVNGDLAQEARRQLLAGHGVGQGEIDLVHPPFYLAEPLERFYPEVMSFADLPGRGTLRCPWPETSFCLVTTGDQDLAARAVLRLPPIPGAEGRRQGRVGVALNGTQLGELEATESWSRHPLRLPAHALSPGLNRLTLTWPLPPPVGQAALDAARRRLELGREADLHPVFGELFSLVVGGP